MRIDARELLAVGIFGRASLSGRIETLLKRGREFSPRASRARIAVGVAILLLFAAASVLAPRWIVFAQKPVFAQQSSATTFEVASVRPSRPGTPWTIRFSAGGRIDAQGVSLRQLIQEAWHVRAFQVSGGPAGMNSEWLNSDRYDIAAKADGNPPEAQIRLLTRTLLADRFKLALHTERKEFDVYTLVVAKNGPKLKSAAGAAGKHLPTRLMDSRRRTPRRYRGLNRSTRRISFRQTAERQSDAGSPRIQWHWSHGHIRLLSGVDTGFGRHISARRSLDFLRPAGATRT